MKCLEIIILVCTAGCVLGLDVYQDDIRFLKEELESLKSETKGLKENVTTLQEENSQLKESIKEKETKMLALNTVVKDDTKYLLQLLQYNISLLRQKDEDLQTLIKYDMSNLKSNLRVLQQNLERESAKTSVIRGFTCQNRNNIMHVHPNRPIIFDTVISNHGSGYNPSTGIYTADKQGWYTFFNEIRVLSGNYICWIDMVRNGVRISTTFAESSKSAHSHISDSSMAFVHLNIGDRVWLHSVKYHIGECSIDDLSSFAGFLVNAV